MGSLGKNASIALVIAGILAFFFFWLLDKASLEASALIAFGTIILVAITIIIF